MGIVVAAATSANFLRLFAKIEGRPIKIPKTPKPGKVVDWHPKLHSTSGGDRDTELNELAVSPTSCPCASRAVTMVTPVAN